MKALVLERQRVLRLRDIDIEETLTPGDVRIAVKAVGICGSDLHYYTDGRVGPFVVEAPLVLGHEGAGTVLEVGDEVEHLAVGDNVCMEPGIPDWRSRAARIGRYNLDESVTFWATPPVHGCLRETVVHPADLTYRLPEDMTLAEGALIEPLAVGVHAAARAGITPGDIAVVTGAGTIGIMTALAALAGGCARVIISDILQAKLDLAASLGAITPVNVSTDDLTHAVMDMTGDWGADIVFEASGSARAAEAAFGPLRPGGTVVFVGMPNEPVSFDLVAMQAKEPTIETVFRYANVYERSLELVASGQVDIWPVVTDTFAFDDAVAAFDFAAEGSETSVKVQIEL